MSIPEDFCPFIGIEPFTESDRDYFFGRGREQRIIVSNLYASPLTVLYGASGAGKTSVLLAGVIPQLRASFRTAVVVFREWQDDAFVDLLKSKCVAAIELAQQKPLDVDLSLPFDEFIHAAGQLFQGTILIIFDQFEEYFLYNPNPKNQESFEVEFARTINREEIDVNFLLALREDGLSKLDRFKTRIPNLLSNLLPLYHMNLKAAENAIRKPLDVYNERQTKDGDAISIEDRLVTDLLEQVRAGQVQVGGGMGSGAAEGQKEYERVEAPFLQLVVTRLWKKEKQSRSRVLRKKTLKKLGGAQTIVRTHLDDLMKKLRGAELELCARIFDRLVTPSGSKIAIKDTDLAEYAGDLKSLLPVVLQKLAAPDARVLRRLPVPGAAEGHRYEIYHDVLAAAIIEWQARFIDSLKEKYRIRRRMMQLSLATAAVLIIMAIGVIRYYSIWVDVRPWGLLNNLSTGSVHVFRDETVTVGRDARYLDFKNTVSLLPNYVSRIHLLMSRDLKAIDMRSLSGTTIGRNFLPYGDTRELEDGDFIVLADCAPFQFKKISYRPRQFWEPPIPQDSPPPPDAWGMFLDLISREVIYLTGNQYFMTEKDTKSLSLTPDKPDNWICTLGLDPRNIAIYDRIDDRDLFAEIKTGDTYTYRAGIVPAGKAYRTFDWQILKWARTRGRDDMKEDERHPHAVFSAIFHTSAGRYFRIIPIIPDLEPRKQP